MERLRQRGKFRKKHFQSCCTKQWAGLCRELRGLRRTPHHRALGHVSTASHSPLDRAALRGVDCPHPTSWLLLRTGWASCSCQKESPSTESVETQSARSGMQLPPRPADVQPYSSATTEITGGPPGSDTRQQKGLLHTDTQHNPLPLLLSHDSGQLHWRAISFKI